MAGVKGRSGRKPLSPAEKAKRAAKKQYAEAITEAEIPPPPDTFNSPSINYYYETYRLLLGVATLADAAVIAKYAYTMTQWDEVTALLEERGYMDDREKVHPLFQIQTTLADRIMKLQTKLGLSPADRRATFPSVNAPKEEQGPTAESLLRLRRGENETIKLA